MAVQSQIETITLLKAKAYLDKNVVYERGAEDTNRPVSLRVVNNYAKSMLRGEWRLTHQGIAFDLKDHLKDGQHRLMALVQAAEDGALDGDEVLPADPKISIKMLVTRGLEKDIFAYLDQGSLRSSANILAMSGYANTAHLGAAGRLLYLYDNYEYKYWRATKVPNKQVLETVQKNALNEYLPVCTLLTQVGIIASAATVGYFVCERAHPEGPHMEFIEALRQGVNLAADSPALVLRNYMIRSRGTDAGARRDSFTHLALYIKTWNDFVLKRRRSAISWRNNEAFPIPYDVNTKNNDKAK